MAKRKRRRKTPKHNIRKGTCKIITIKGGGKRKLCRLKNGKMRFRKMGRSR